MIVGYFRHDHELNTLLEDGCVTLPANRNYSTTFEISDATGTWNVSGPNFS